MSLKEAIGLKAVFDRARVCQEQWDWQIAEMVAGLRAGSSWLFRNDHGVTWQEVGEALGISRQAAQQRFGAKSDEIWRERASEEEDSLGLDRADEQDETRAGVEA